MINEAYLRMSEVKGTQKWGQGKNLEPNHQLVQPCLKTIESCLETCHFKNLI